MVKTVLIVTKCSVLCSKQFDFDLLTKRLFTYKRNVLIPF